MPLWNVAIIYENMMEIASGFSVGNGAVVAVANIVETTAIEASWNELVLTGSKLTDCFWGINKISNLGVLINTIERITTKWIYKN